MQLQTISQVSKSFGVSTRLLRYYEQIGLLRSTRREEYAYRVYDERELTRLGHILLLRKLRIPLKQIAGILDHPDAAAAVAAFEQNIRRLDREISALSTIRAVLNGFLEELQTKAHVSWPGELLDDEAALHTLDSLPLTRPDFKEEPPMEKLNKANEELSTLTDVRIVCLPPATVAAAHYVGDEPENHTTVMLSKFVLETNLCARKPGLRHYGFNHPNPVDETGFHGYEMWVTIPDDMEVPSPLVKKHFAGGLYAAHMIPMGNFHEWAYLEQWVMQSEQYTFNGDSTDSSHMFGLLEEHLNYLTHVQNGCVEPEDMQLDLLMPVRKK